MIVGSPDEVAEQLRKVATNLNVGHLMLLMQFGNMNRQLTQYNTELFAKRVLPQLAPLFDDRWEDPWWPRALPPAETAQSARAAGMSDPAERHVLVNGRRCRVWEKGEGEPLGFLGGLRGLPRWPRLLDLLAEQRRVIAPSLPGQPGATGFDELDDLPDWVTASLDLLDAAGLDGADLIGASVGATLAAEVAAFSRASVRRLVLIAPFGLFDEREPVKDLWATRPDELPALLSTRPAELAAYLAPPRGRGRGRVVDPARARERGGGSSALAAGRAGAAQAAAPRPGADARALGRRGPHPAAELRQEVRLRAGRLGRGARDRGRRPPGRARPARRGGRRDPGLPLVTRPSR